MNVRPVSDAMCQRREQRVHSQAALLEMTANERPHVLVACNRYVREKYLDPAEIQRLETFADARNPSPRIARSFSFPPVPFLLFSAQNSRLPLTIDLDLVSRPRENRGLPAGGLRCG